MACFSYLNPFMHNVVKWPNILLKSCFVNNPRFLKYVWPFYDIMYKRVNRTYPFLGYLINRALVSVDRVD